MSGDALSAVWQAGCGTQWWRNGMSVRDLEAQDATHFANGLRLTSLSLRGDAFAAVWRDGEGAQWWRAGMSVQELEAQDAAHFANGLRIAAMTAENGRYAVVWRPGDGAQWWRAGMSVQELEAQDAVHFGNGLRLTSVVVENGSFTAVWRPGDGAQWWRSGMSTGDLEAQDAAHFANGLYLSTLAYDHGWWTAVWRPGAGEQWWSAGRGVVDLQTEDAASFGRGLRLRTLVRTDDPGSPYRLPWAGGTTHSCNQGNNGPISHSGSQAFAWDFGLPSGTSVRAARAGVVEAVEQGRAENPSQTGFSGTEFWGNFVRVRHAGGFTSWYFHLQENSASVAVGDQVARGQQLALSGNTGRSTGAHLHVQVQADSVDWGMSVPITFGPDCVVPNGGDSLTSDNAP